MSAQIEQQLAEDASERKAFDDATKNLYDRDAFKQILHTLKIWSCLAQGSFCKLSAIMYNELTAYDASRASSETGDDRVSTHWSDCYLDRKHHGCAVAEVARLRGLLASTTPALQGRMVPDGYVYRYPGNHFSLSANEHWNGCEPEESRPFYYSAPANAKAGEPDAVMLEELPDDMACACVDCGHRPESYIYLYCDPSVLRCAGCGATARTLSDWNAKKTTAPPPVSPTAPVAQTPAQALERDPEKRIGDVNLNEPITNWTDTPKVSRQMWDEEKTPAQAPVMGENRVSAYRILENGVPWFDWHDGDCPASERAYNEGRGRTIELAYSAPVPTAQTPAQAPAVASDVRHAYECGWIVCAEWAKRNDLVSDVGSPAYIRDRDSALPAVAHEVDYAVEWPFIFTNTGGMEYVPRHHAEHRIAALAIPAQASSEDVRDAARYRGLRAVAKEELTPGSGRPESVEHRMRYVLPPLVSWADFCGPISFDEAVDAAIAGSREDEKDAARYKNLRKAALATPAKEKGDE